VKRALIWRRMQPNSPIVALRRQFEWNIRSVTPTGADLAPYASKIHALKCIFNKMHMGRQLVWHESCARCISRPIQALREFIKNISKPSTNIIHFSLRKQCCQHYTNLKSPRRIHCSLCSENENNIS
jgi:hypothetical protein